MSEKGSKTSYIKVQIRIQPILEYSGVLHRDRANPVCDWQGAGGGGRSGDASQGQTEVRMAWADAMPRPEHLGVLRPRAGRRQRRVPRTQSAQQTMRGGSDAP